MANTNDAGLLMGWYLNVCAFALRVEGQLGTFEAQLDALGSPLVSERARGELRGLVDQIRAAFDAFLGFLDAKLEAVSVPIAELLAATKPPVEVGKIEENIMGDIVRDLDLRAVVTSLLGSGKHDNEKVTEVVDLAVRYCDELDRRRSGPQGRGARGRGRSVGLGGR